MHGLSGWVAAQWAFPTPQTVPWEAWGQIIHREGTAYAECPYQESEFNNQLRGDVLELFAGPPKAMVRAFPFKPPRMRFCSLGGIQHDRWIGGVIPCFTYKTSSGQIHARFRSDRGGKYVIRYSAHTYATLGTATKNGESEWMLSVGKPGATSAFPPTPVSRGFGSAWANTFSTTVHGRVLMPTYRRTDSRGTISSPARTQIRDSLVIDIGNDKVFDVVAYGMGDHRATTCVSIDRVTPHPSNPNATLTAEFPPQSPITLEILEPIEHTLLDPAETDSLKDLGFTGPLDQVTVFTSPGGIQLFLVTGEITVTGVDGEEILTPDGGVTPIHVPSVQEIGGTRYTLEPVSRESSGPSGITLEIGAVTGPPPESGKQAMFTSPRSQTANPGNRPYTNRLVLTDSANVRVYFSEHPLCPVDVANTAQNYPAQSGSGSVTATAAASCSYPIRSTAPWITITNGTTGSGNRTVTYMVDANTSNSPRMAAVRIGGRIMHVAQAGSNVSQEFSDVQAQHPFFSFITVMKRQGITQGCSATQYCPDAPVTRGQMAVFLIRAMFGGHEFPYERTVPFFTDVPVTHPYFRFIQKLRELGITQGCTETTYCPDAPVTRGQMAVFVTRSVHGDTFSFTPQPYFTDVQPAHPFFSYVQKMKDFGFTSGCSATEYCQTASITRGQMSAFIVRAFEAPW
ncbi:MAG: S-layer homology domain-containing protein [Bryobacterales bacterium]|nr:S-layer homology domain-containing protein [Bryobacterales bacterium]